MSAPGLPGGAVVTPSSGGCAEAGPTWVGLFRAEWVKTWSLRSTTALLVAAVSALLGVSGLLSWLSLVLTEDPAAVAAAGSGFAVSSSLAGAPLAAVLAGALGVTSMTGDYSTGAMRAAATVVPRRTPLLWAKAGVVAAVVAAVLGAAVVGAFALGQLVRSANGTQASFGDPAVPGVLAGTVAALVGVALAGLGLGAVLQRTAAALAALMALVHLVPLAILPLGGLAAARVADRAHLGAAVSALSSVSSDGADRLVGSLVLTAWVAGLLALGGAVLRRRDL